jgi:hypothetical protein
MAGDAEHHAVVHIEWRASIIDLDDVVNDKTDAFTTGSTFLACKAVAALHVRSPLLMIP